MLNNNNNNINNNNLNNDINNTTITPSFPISPNRTNVKGLNTNGVNNTNNNSINNNNHNTNTIYSGFSLIELSMVLIVIGLLVTGVVKGYALMSASKIVTLTNELTRYSFAAEQFNAKYGNLPGIIDNPQKLFGSQAKYKIDEDKTDPYAINESGEVTNAESINFFNHLALSKLIDKDETLYVGTDNDLSNRNEITKKSKYYPTLKSIKNAFIYVRGDSIDGNYNKLNRLTIAHYTNSKFGINADMLQGLDSKVDDGLPLSGLISIVPTVLLNDDTNTNNNTNTDAKVNINNKDNSDNNILSFFKLINNVNATESNTNTKDACIVLNKETNTIEYNKKGRNCFLLKSVDSTKRNEVTDLGINNITGTPCQIQNTDNYPNAEILTGITMLNGTTRKVNCNTGYSGDITLTCNEGVIEHSGDEKCSFNGCSVDALTANSSLLGNNTTSVIEMVLCNDESCSNIDSSNVIDITLEDNKSKTYESGQYITVNSCDTGYSVSENKRIIRCNDQAKWEVVGEGDGEMCTFTGCNDMSAVFDKNGNMVSEQLYKMQFAINTTRMYPILACKDATNNGSAQDLSTNNNFIVNINTEAYCGEGTGASVEDGGNRVYTCTQDTTNINNGNSYWKVNYASCDLNEINNKGYTVYLANDKVESFTDVNSSTLTINTKTTQKRLIANQWGSSTSNGGIYTNQHNNFRLYCNSSGNWVMEKTANSCQGVPTLVTGGKFYNSDTNIKYVDGQPGMLMNTSTFTKDTSTLTKTMLSNTSQYFVINGTKIEANCNTGYTEVDKNGKISGASGAETGGHYYECVNGTWTARGGCKKNCSGNITLSGTLTRPECTTCDAITQTFSCTASASASHGKQVSVSCIISHTFSYNCIFCSDTTQSKQLSATRTCNNGVWK